MTDLTTADLTNVTTLAGLIEAAATADGRTYLDWGLVYQFTRHMGIKLTGIANHKTFTAVLAAGFDPFTANLGAVDADARFAAQVA